MPDTLFTFDALATLAGASFLVYLVVAYTKSLADRWLKIATDLYAVLVGACILIVAQLALGANSDDWRVYVLGLFNGFLVAATAGKMSDKAIMERDRKDNQGAV